MRKGMKKKKRHLYVCYIFREPMNSFIFRTSNLIL